MNCNKLFYLTTARQQLMFYYLFADLRRFIVVFLARTGALSVPGREVLPR